MGSLFAGIGGFDLGFERAGFNVAWHAEIDRHASAVLRERWPDVPNLGDVTKIDGAVIEPVDVICGGFPCQDLSVAGKRAGFTGKRSVLAFEFLRIVSEMREATNGSSPTLVVLENVPGLFSSSSGRDFAALLDALAELRPMDIAWRVLDSRYFDVAQRRERVFVVVDFGGERADEILALSEGLRGNPPARRAAREDVAGISGGGSQSRGWCDDLDRAGAFITNDVAFPVLSREGKGPASSVDSGNIVVTHTLRADGFDASEDGTGRGTPLVCDTVRSHPRPGSNSVGLVVAILADPISAHEQSTYTHEGNTFRLHNVIPFDTTQCTSALNRSVPQPGAPCHPLAAGAHAPAVAYGIRNDAARDGVAKADSPDAEGRLRKRDAGFNVYREQAPTLDATAPHSVAFNWQNGGGYGEAHDGLAVSEEHTPPMSRSQVAAVAFTVSAQANGFAWESPVAPTLGAHPQSDTSQRQTGIRTASGVRRLTPRECERLQGFPDVAESAIIAVCGEKQNSDAVAVLQSLRSRSNASPVEEGALSRFAPYVELRSGTHRPDLAIPADLTVLVDSERGAVLIHSHGKSLWSVRDADDGGWSLLSIPPAAFVRLAVDTLQCLAPETVCGEADSPRNSEPSVVRWHGSALAVLSGRVIEGAAVDAGPDIITASQPSTSITSRATESSRPSGSRWKTLCSSVVDAIASFIPEPTWRESGFVLRLTVVSPWTRFGVYPDGTRRELADGPRYKCLGNAVTVNVIEWIARRIA